MNFICFPSYSSFRTFFPDTDENGMLCFKLSDKPSARNGKDQVAFISYDLKNRFEDLSSSNPSPLAIPDITYYSIEEKINLEKEEVPLHSEIQIRCRVNRQEYIDKVRSLKDHIHSGNIYEVNYCIEFFAEDASIDPYTVYQKLSSISEAPFSFFSKVDNLYILCSSPERFLKLEQSKLISQPIKGTIRRGSSEEEDEALIRKLKSDPKERSENIMIVDLVRNDLSRVAKKGSVHVEELCGIYSFRQVHQMISTVACETVESFDTILEATFPMGSMTGAPKIRAMELIEEHENFRRGMYSGSVGVMRAKEFDLNVIIRTLIYDSEKRYLSFSVGSAITAEADPEKEYDECLLKARAMFIALGCEDQWNSFRRNNG